MSENCDASGIKTIDAELVGFFTDYFQSEPRHVLKLQIESNDRTMLAVPDINPHKYLYEKVKVDVNCKNGHMDLYRAYSLDDTLIGENFPGLEYNRP